MKPIRLEVRRLPRMNALGQHWRERTRERRSYAWELRQALGPMPKLWQPIEHAHVTFVRHSSREPDDDNLVASFKTIRDLLMVPSKRNPAGLSLIRDDSPAHLVAEYRWEKAPRGQGYIEIVVEEA